MTIKMKALIQTLKIFGFGVAIGIGYSVFIDLFGLMSGIFGLVIGFAAWTIWIGYQANLASLELQENSDKSV